MKRNTLFGIELLFLLSGMAFCQADNSHKLALERRVSELLKMTNVNRRPEVDKFFELGDIYAEEGNSQKARRMYEEGLAVDSWNYAYQLKHAEMLLEQGQKEQALEKIRAVYEYAEEEPLIRRARDIRKQHGEPVDLPNTEEPDEVKKPILFLVPLGGANSFLLEEVERDLETFMGLNFVILKNDIEIGSVDRTTARKMVESMIQNIREKTEEEDLQLLLRNLKVDPASLDEYAGQKNFLLRFMKEFYSADEYREFEQKLGDYEKEGQYNADRLQDLLRKHTPPRTGSTAGYLGITASDMYSEDFNFLFGWAGPGYGVMSYHRFRAAFNASPQNRPLLRKRTVKQAVSSSFYILGIGRCTSPMCMRAYPNSLEEHDQKSFELCSYCKKELAKKLAELSGP